MKLRLFSRASLRDHSAEAQKEASSSSRECEIGGEHAAEPKTPTATTYLSQPQATSNPAAIPFPVLNDVGAGGHYPDREHPVFDSRDNTAGSQALKDRRRSTAGPHDIHPAHHSHSRGESTDINIIDNSVAQGQYGRRSSNHLLFDSTRGHSHQKLFDADQRKHSMYDHEPEVGDTSGLSLAATGTGTASGDILCDGVLSWRSIRCEPNTATLGDITSSPKPYYYGDASCSSSISHVISSRILGCHER
ncbi:hypothetical protein EDD22DRAFT_66714 [Suillus occidentalis]|nr:hypothetical protein EDD22DRAFT_66714 [Suillus occidentalis]